MHNKKFYLSLHRQNQSGARSSSPKQGCLFYVRCKEIQRQPREVVETPSKAYIIPDWALTARSAAIFICQNSIGMVNYELETRIRKQRKQLAIERCKSWTLYYYNGEYAAAPNITHEMVKRTPLPPTNNGQITKIISL